MKASSWYEGVLELFSAHCGVTGNFFQNPPLKLRGARGVMKQRDLSCRREVEK